MRKNVVLGVTLLLAIGLLSGCGKGDTEQTEQSVPVVPDGAVEQAGTDKIVMEDLSIVLPDDMKYGAADTENGKVYYVWGGDDDYIMPQSHDIMLYIYEGTDRNTPDQELEDKEARTSIYQSYMQIFRSTVENGQLAPDPMVVSNENWYTLCMTGHSGNDYKTTTYGTLCYPKSYYGIYTLKKSNNADYSRNYYGFIFSNNGKGEIFSEEDYGNLLNQIKSAFAIEKFYSITDTAASYDEAKDTSKGYSYEQLEDMFTDTANYYKIAASNSNGEDSD